MYKLVCFLLIITLCSSCCTMTRGTEQKLLVDSNPRGATINVDGYDCGMTPQYVLLERNHPHKISIEKEGYPTSTHFLQPKPSVAVATNVVTPLVSGALGAGIGAICAKGAYGGLLIPGFALVGVVLGSVIGIIGSGVDLYTGAGKNLDAEVIQADLY